MSPAVAARAPEGARSPAPAAATPRAEPHVAAPEPGALALAVATTVPSGRRAAAAGDDPPGGGPPAPDPAPLMRQCARCEVAAEEEQSGGAPQRPCAECTSADEELQRSPAGPDPSAPPASGRERADAAVASALGSGGRPLDPATRAFFEAGFGRDLGHVRLHTGSAADLSTRAVNALAFTVGRDVVFRDGQYDPHGSEGTRLLAHELTHVLQQGHGAAVAQSPPRAFRVSRSGEPAEVEADRVAASLTRAASAPPVGVTPATPHEAVLHRRGGALDQALQSRVDEFNQDLEDWDQLGNHGQVAYTLRVLMLLGDKDGDSFADEGELENFLDDAQVTALDENATIARLGDVVTMSTEAFPLFWSDKVREALHVDVDPAAMAQDITELRQVLTAEANRVPGGILDSGLPVGYQDALTLSYFRLELRYLNWPADSVVKDFARAGREFALKGFVVTFFTAWNAIIDNLAESVASGEHVVSLLAYWEFILARQAGVRSLADRMAQVSAEDGFTALDQEVIDLSRVALIASFASGLIGLAGGAALWGQAVQMFDDELAVVDTSIAGQSDVDKVLRAFIWAHEGGYFLGAGEQLWEAIKKNGWKILGMAVGFIIVQFIPVLDVAVDVVVAIYSGLDALDALANLYDAFERVLSSKSAVDLQRYSAQMAGSLIGDGSRVLMDLFAIAASVKGIRARADALRAADASLGQEAALRRALSESTGEEAAALQQALVRQRIIRNFDPGNILGEVMDRGVAPDVVEQALLSGMSPERLSKLVLDVGDAGRAQQIIEYAGSYSSPVNKLIDAGLPHAEVGRMADLDLNLQALGTLDTILARTRNILHVQGALDSFSRFASDEISAMARRLTPDGMASVYIAGGENALRTITDAFAAEQRGAIAGVDDWIRFTLQVSKKQGADLLNTMRELSEAQRLAAEAGPGRVVRVGADVRAPAGARSFDVAVESGAAVERSVEVKTVTDPVELSSDVSGPVRDAINKVSSRAAGGAPIPGAHDLSVYMSLRVGERTLRGGAGTLRISATGAVEQVVAGRVIPKGNILDDVAGNLSAIKNNALLDRVTLVDRASGDVLALYERSPAGWTRVR